MEREEKEKEGNKGYKETAFAVCVAGRELFSSLAKLK